MSEGQGGGPGEHYTTRDYTDAVWNLENHVRVRSVERVEHEDCDVQTYTTSEPRGGSGLTYARVISPENTYCSGDEGDELREELQQRAKQDETVFHSSPMDGNRRDYFGYWSIDDDAIDTRNHVLARDLTELEWNGTQNRVIGGEFSDPYTGEREYYGRASTVIDHIMGVEHAWVEMEHRDDERRAFYNDPSNLLATSAGMLRQKNADAPRNWMPENEGFHCRYAMAWAHSAVKHEVSLFASGIDELRGTLYRCVDQQTDDGESLDAQRRSGLEWASLPPY